MDIKNLINRFGETQSIGNSKPYCH